MTETQKIGIQNLPGDISESDIKNHKISPEHIRDVLIEDNIEGQKKRVLTFAKEVTRKDIKRRRLSPEQRKNFQIEMADQSTELLKIPGLKIETVEKIEDIEIPDSIMGHGPSKHLDLQNFGDLAHFILQNAVIGYMLQIRQHGNLIWSANYDWSQSPSDEGEGWTPDTKMNVASVSKWLTAVGLVKALNDNGISYSDNIINYLPAYWSFGSNINQITFDHLLTHRSGFMTGTWKSDYKFMKDQVASGVSNVGSPSGYQNINFGLMRILIPMIIGETDININYADYDENLNDQAWDFVTISRYREYMLSDVFGPAQVYGVDFVPDYSAPWIKRALAYKPYSYWMTDKEKGFDSGDQKTMSGTSGWRLSINQLLNVMDHFRRKNTIIDSGIAQDILDLGYGIDESVPTDAGRWYNKNGKWNGDNGTTEQDVIFFLPEDMELALFVNSPITELDFSLRDQVAFWYRSSLAP